MKIAKLSVIAMLGVAAMSSCSNDNELSSERSEYVTSVRVTVEDFLPESPATRTSYTVDANGFNFHWADGDALGIYPVGGDQVKFPISQGDGSASASFDGGAWKLRSTYQYAAYYPFSAANYTIDQKALPASFTGQTQNGNGSTAHLGAYDYLACAATSPSAGGGVDLTMKHLGAFVRLQLTMPKADTFSSVVLESDDAQFVTSGTFDLTAATPAITPTATSSTYTINLTNVATTEKDQVITVYAIVAPANLSTNNITVTVHGAGQATYVQTVPGKNFEARRAYNIAVETFPSGTNASGEDVSWEEPAATTGTENGHEWVDLGLSVKWATMNVRAGNCEDIGWAFTWGDIDIPSIYDWSGYRWCNGSATSITKYSKELDNKTILDPEDDAAHIYWGGAWRMPTLTELDELRNKCTWTGDVQNDMNGYIVVGPNGNSIFLPATGYQNGRYASSFGTKGYYWSSSLGTSPDLAYYLTFDPSNVTCDVNSRCRGYYIRAVCQ